MIMQAGYHTIADYMQNYSKRANVIYRDVKIIDPFIMIFDFPFIPEKGAYEIRQSREYPDAVLKMKISDKTCDVKFMSHFVESNFLRVPLCFNISEIEEDSFVRYNPDLKTIIFPQKLGIRLIPKNSTLENLVFLNIKKISLKAAKDFSIKPEDLSLMSSVQYQIGEKNFYYVVSRINIKVSGITIHSQWKPEEWEPTNFSFYVVHLVKEGKPWYIADSAHKRCEGGIKDVMKFSESYRERRELESIYGTDYDKILSEISRLQITSNIKNRKFVVGDFLPIFGANDYDNDGYPDTISFGLHSLLYHLDFGNDLIVLKDADEKTEMWHEKR